MAENLQGRRVLIVEDDAANLEYYGEFLSEHFRVAKARNTAVALELLAEQEFDLVLTDFQMPDGDGIAFSAEVNRLYPKIPVIMITGYGSKDLLQSAVRVRVFDFLEKPSDEDMLLERIRGGLRHKAGQEEQERLVREAGARERELALTREHNEELARAMDELRRTRQQMIHSAKYAYLGEMASGVAHELNNPLTVIKGLSQYLGKGRAGPEKTAQVAAKVEDAADRMANIIRHMREYARQSGGIRKSGLDLCRLIRNAFMLHDEQLRIHNISVDLDLPAEPVIIDGDPNRLESVFRSLILNSRDAFEERGSEERGRISVQVQKKADRILVQFEDDAGGMPKEICDRVFEPFFTTREVGKGRGLGLSVSYGIMGEHAGEMQLQNNPGLGVCFELGFPLPEGTGEEAGAEPESVPPVIHQGDKPAILIVDDDQDVVWTLETLLEDDFTMTVCTSSPEAMELLDQRPFDLVLADMKMPVYTGGDLIEKARQVNPDLPVIIITGHLTGDDEIREVVASGARAVIRKPFENPDQLVTVIRRHLKSA